MVIKTTAESRKDVVNVISNFTGLKAAYQGPPTFAYKIGDFLVGRDGNVEVKYEDTGTAVKEMLIKKGFAEADVENVEIKIPMDSHTGASLRNLAFMLHSKKYLLNKVLQREVFHVNEELVKKLLEKDLESREEFIGLFNECGGSETNKGLYFTNDAIIFDGFPLEKDGLKIKAYAELSALMCSQAIIQKRVSPKETVEDNEKYYMRVWLIRLGLGGKGGEDTRKVLLKNLKGHTAFRTEEEIERAKEKAKSKKISSK